MGPVAGALRWGRLVTPAATLTRLTRPQLIDRVRELEMRVESLGGELDLALRLVESTAAEGMRAERRLACWAVSHVLGEIGRWAREQECVHCGSGIGWEHLHDFGNCGAFTCAEPGA